MTDFYYKTTKAFDVTITVNGVAQDISGDTSTLIFKKKKTDTDDEAVLIKETFENTVDGVAKFKLTPTDTDLPIGAYYYEIKWVNSSNVYIRESDTVKVLERVFD